MDNYPLQLLTETRDLHRRRASDIEANIKSTEMYHRELLDQRLDNQRILEQLNLAIEKMALDLAIEKRAAELGEPGDRPVIAHVAFSPLAPRPSPLTS